MVTFIMRISRIICRLCTANVKITNSLISMEFLKAACKANKSLNGHKLLLKGSA